jgi:hypothetical protein
MEQVYRTHVDISATAETTLTAYFGEGERVHFALTTRDRCSLSTRWNASLGTLLPNYL